MSGCPSKRAPARDLSDSSALSAASLPGSMDCILPSAGHACCARSHKHTDSGSVAGCVVEIRLIPGAVIIT